MRSGRMLSLSGLPARLSQVLGRQPRMASTTRGRSLRPTTARAARLAGLSGGALVLGVSASSLCTAGLAPIVEASDASASAEDRDELVNWSGTHSCTPARVHHPETTEEVVRLLGEAHACGGSLRPVGSALSPNGIGFSDGALINLALCDRVLSVDAETKQVRVEAGITVEKLVKALQPHGLSLENYASITEQQIGGFLQVGAHGTGASIPPADMMVVSMKIATPAEGVLLVSRTERPELFRAAKLGLGSLGIVLEATLQCVNAHLLLEQTFATTMPEIRRNHNDWLRNYRHLRYMWVPHTDTVVVVRSNPCSAAEAATALAAAAPASDGPQASAPMRQFLQDCLLGTNQGPNKEEIAVMPLPALRDALLRLNPLDVEHVKKVNEAEASFWKESEGLRVGTPEDILQFECGGQQWVWEMCIPTGGLARPSHDDIDLVESILKEINEKQLPAPSPIEQRWTAQSDALLSPARPAVASPGAVFSWVGIIMYLPTNDAEERGQIGRAFNDYRLRVQGLAVAFGAVPHWAKIEPPCSSEEGTVEAFRQKLALRYPLAAFAAWRARLDPKNVLGGPIVDAVCPNAALPS